MVYLPFTTSGQEMEQVYFVNPGSCTGLKEDWIQHPITRIPTRSYLQPGCPSCHPANIVKTPKAKKNSTARRV